jgi:transcriptional regulator with PAS, ATPase and Fis domain
LREINDAVKNICGYTRDDIGKDIRSLSQSCNGKCVNAVIKTIKEKKDVEVHRLECEHKERRHMVVSLQTSPLLLMKGELASAVLVVRDETRLDNLERDLKDRLRFHGFISRNKKMQEIFNLIENLADVQTTVLITGESGTGKELVAEALHHRGSRSSKSLVKVNCSALSENLLESELFGHVKGAFTGAIKDKIGRFQLADGGTLFLDEIGDISPRTQVQLLRVLQNMEFERVGESTPIRVDVRVIAATNQNLDEKVRSGKFREDLFYRLKVVEIELPSLRQRGEDIPLLVNQFIQKFNKKFSKNISAVTEDVQKLFMDYDWPGNVRELEHALEHAFIICTQDTITLQHIPHNINTQTFPRKGFEEIDHAKVLEALNKAGWNKSKAARALGVNVRTIYRKIEKYGMIEPASDK